MKLSVTERLVVLSILPAEGDLLTLRLVRDLRRALSFNEEEHSSMQIDQADGKVSWKNEQAPVDIHIGPKMHVLIQDTFAALDKSRKLSLSALPVYERFLEDA
jgi:hypothetical protein